MGNCKSTPALVETVVVEIVCGEPDPSKLTIAELHKQLSTYDCLYKLSSLSDSQYNQLYNYSRNNKDFIVGMRLAEIHIHRQDEMVDVLSKDRLHKLLAVYY